MLQLMIFAVATLSAQSSPSEWLNGLHRTLGNHYATSIAVEAEGMDSMRGYFVVEGDSYYLTLGAMEVYSDGKLRYEVNNSRKEVVEDRANLEARDLLSNPTRAFEFVEGEYNISIKESSASGVTLSIEPTEQSYGDMQIELTLSREGERVLPRKVAYNYDGEHYAISLELLDNVALEPVPEWNRGDYRAYDIVSFL